MRPLIITVLIFIFLSTPNFGQEIYLRQVEKNKLGNVEKKINKAFKKNPNDVILHYTMSRLLLKRNFKGYNTKKSYDFINRTEEIYFTIKREKELKDLDKIPINSNLILNYVDSICRYALADALEVNSVNGYEDYLSYYQRANSDYKFTATQKRDIAAFLVATSQNTVESYEYFISKYPTAIQQQEAILKRDSIAFSRAVEMNNISSYEIFIQQYPNAQQIKEAWERIYSLAYDEAVERNTIPAFRAYITRYPNSKQVKAATEKIHEIAFASATAEKTSKALKSFIQEYPKSKQLAEATDLFYKLEFEENTSQGIWESYKMFIELFESPYEKNAIDSIFDIGSKGNYQAFEYIIKNNYKKADWKELTDSYFSVIKTRGEYSEVSKLLNEHNSLLDETQLSELYTQIGITKEAEELKLDLPFNMKNKEKYIDFIKRSGDIELNFVILQRLISIDIIEKKYENAIKTINGLEAYFIKKSNSVASLKALLKENYDRTINPIALKEINTNGNEYSPVISADNQVLFFCGKDRDPLIKNEQLLYSTQNDRIWSTPYSIERTSFKEENFAPLANSADGNTLYVFSEGQIYESNKTTSGWSDLNIMSEHINTKSWEGDLTISSDNNTLIFARGNAVLEKNIDIVFLVDATGSMQPCISGVQSNIYNFINGIKTGESIVNWRAKVVYYRDFQKDGPRSFINNPFTSNIEELQWQLNQIASGGDDEPESTFESIYKTLKETNWNTSENCARVIISFTDATNKPWTSPQTKAKYGKIDENKILNELKLKKTRLIFFGQNFYQYANLYSEFTDITLYDNARSELQTADYSILMNEISQKVSLLSSNTQLYHGDRLPLSDLFICHKDQNGKWGKILNLSSKLNTPYTERSPFLHPDLKTLYFSSDGHGGLGKLDVYMTKRLADSCWDCWSDPINLGKEINGPNSDWGYKISTDGEVAYFSKDSKLKTREDIYKITLPPHLRPDVVARIEGQLKDSDNKAISTSIQWEDLENNKIMGTAKTDPNDGSYFIVLPMGKNYGYFIEDTSFFPIAQNIDLRDSTKAVDIKKDIKVISFEEMIDKGISVPMNNLFFDFGKYDLLPSSIPELKRVANIIKRYNLKIEISGHTDDIGEDRNNQILSERRSKSVKDFFIESGCNERLLQTIGYGESKPIDTNETEKGRANNRRVEIKFIK
jgi:outer membrane protein OmpA-like peptidoglycan-associated protein/TolA-binding protein